MIRKGSLDGPDSGNIDEDNVTLEIVRPHFDTAYYLSRYDDVRKAGIDPLVHFCKYGWREGRDPSPSFSTRFYLLAHTDVAAAAINPLFHYAGTGKNEERLTLGPREFTSIDHDCDHHLVAEMLAIKPKFDVDFYLGTNQDVLRSGIDPLFHFCKFGWREHRDPRLDFSVSRYLAKYPDVAEAGVNPFWHFLIAGSAEGRTLSNSDTFANQTAEMPHPLQLERKIRQEMSAIREVFDAEYYSLRNPDVVAAGLDPADHFVRTGWREGRDPNEEFSVVYYLEANPDVMRAGINPLFHYVIAGKHEGRQTRHPGGDRAAILVQTHSLEQTVREWRSREPPSELLGVTDVCLRMRDVVRHRVIQLMVSIGHDNYLQVAGGVQFCIQREQEIARKRKVLYLNLHPFFPLPRLAHTSQTQDVLVWLVLAGNTIGVAPMSVVTEAIARLTENFSQISVVVHHLMGHNPEQVADLVVATGRDECWMWLHDFFTLCPSYALQRNNVAFCGVPPLGSNACRLCIYGDERNSHRARMTALFERLKVHAVAPSQFAADFWSKHTNLSPGSITVCPHVTLEWGRVKPKARIADGPFRVAFVGYPSPHKGWPMFKRVARQFRGANSRFRFTYFGTSEINLPNVQRIPVQVTREDPEAMIRALAEEEVDIVLHWASCAETFSFSTFEAMAAGAYVITNPNSGNVALAVEQHGLGVVLGGEEELDSFFRDGRLDSMIKELRARRQTIQARLKYSDLTLSLLKVDSQP